ncbi:MAG: carboxymuconolactone decarboxylase family protein [Parasphingorhabdus sp.]
MTDRLMPLEDIPEELRPQMAMMAERMGFTPNSLKIMARKPALVQSFLQMLMVAFGPGCSIDPALRQMFAFMASYGSGCRYCQAHNAKGAAVAGVDPEKIESLWNFEQSDLFDGREKAALAFAFAGGQAPSAVTDEHFSDLQKFFSEVEIVELAGIIAAFGFLNRWNDTMGTPLEDIPRTHAEEVLKAASWEVGKHG